MAQSKGLRRHRILHLSKEDKLKWLNENYLQDDKKIETLKNHWHANEGLQKLYDSFSENTVSNFHLPYGLVPNVLINNQVYCVPMVIEESSVVAAATKGALFWYFRGGFRTELIGTEKVGHVHFSYKGNKETLVRFFEQSKSVFFENLTKITESMRKRGGGVNDILLKDKTDREPHYYQLECTFETCNAMGANFINTCLEQVASTLQNRVEESSLWQKGQEKRVEIIMAILSNYTPQCRVKASVSCPIEEFRVINNADQMDMAKKFCKAIRIAEIEPYRAATHNKGIYNGIDAVAIATGNDFRAVDAAGHAYASQSGSYASLTHAKIEDDTLHYWIDIPISVGTTGGLTGLHALAKISLEILGSPSADELMQIIASIGLAQNFAAVRSLITTGIQSGHMRLHLHNVMNQLGATEQEKTMLIKHFSTGRDVTYKSVQHQIDKLREIH